MFSAEHFGPRWQRHRSPGRSHSAARTADNSREVSEAGFDFAGINLRAGSGVKRKPGNGMRLQVGNGRQRVLLLDRHTQPTASSDGFLSLTFDRDGLGKGVFHREKIE